jgi:hypothetical protein
MGSMHVRAMDLVSTRDLSHLKCIRGRDGDEVDGRWSMFGESPCEVRSHGRTKIQRDNMTG